MTEASNDDDLPEEAMALLAEHWSGESDLPREELHRRLKALGVDPELAGGLGLREIDEVGEVCRSLELRALQEEAASAPEPEWASGLDAGPPAGARPEGTGPARLDRLRAALPPLAAAAAVLFCVNLWVTRAGDDDPGGFRGDPDASLGGEEDPALDRPVLVRAEQLLLLPLRPLASGDEVRIQIHDDLNPTWAPIELKHGTPKIPIPDPSWERLDPEREYRLEVTVSRLLEGTEDRHSWSLGWRP